MKPKYQKEIAKQMRQTQRLKRKRKSKIEAFKKEILLLRHFNLSYQDISIWLDKKHNTKISLSQLHYMVTVGWKNDPFLYDIDKVINHEKSSI